VYSIFSILSRYAFRQEENFLTESLVFLLNLILEREKKIGLDILANLCGMRVARWIQKAKMVSVTSQITVDEGRPDIVIKVGIDKLIFVEVKHNSSLGVEQLERYHAYLDGLIDKETQLVLLSRSRHSIQETSLDGSLYHHICWYEISGWLSEADVRDEVARFIIEQFIDFLKEKEMSMEKVTWEYIQGVPAMINLVNMIGTALSEIAPESSTRKSVGASWAGFYMDGFFIGFRFNSPLLIVFENDAGNDPTFTRDMYLETIHFFSLTAGEQLECLIGFVNNSFQEYENSSK